MKKLLLGLTMIAIVFITIAFGADAYMWNPRGSGDSTHVSFNQKPWKWMYVDTVTFHVEDGDSTVSLGFEGSNFLFRSLNAAGDSGSAIVVLNSRKSFFHADSVSWLYKCDTVGLNTADDYLIAPFMATSYLVRPVVGGAADSTVILEVMFVR